MVLKLLKAQPYNALGVPLQENDDYVIEPIPPHKFIAPVVYGVVLNFQHCMRKKALTFVFLIPKNY